MSAHNIRISTRTHTHEVNSADSEGYSEEGESGPSQDYEETSEEWEDQIFDEDIEPSDSASASPARSHIRTKSIPRQASRRHRPPHRPASGYAYRPAPNPPGSLDYDDFSYGSGPAPGPGAGRGYPPGGGPYPYGRGAPAPGYPQSHVGGYGPPFANQQVVPYGGYGQNPFAPMNGNGNYFQGDHGWGRGEMLPYGQQYFNGAGAYPVPPGMAQYQWSPPPPPPTELGQPRTPAPTEGGRLDPEKEAMKKRLAEIEAVQAKKDAEAKQKEMEARIKEEAEANFLRKMEQMQREEKLRAEERADALEKAKKEIEIARKEAERAAREAVEAERKAEAERKRAEAEAIIRAERDARDKLQAERRAEDAQKKKDEEAAAAAEAAAKTKLEAAIRANDEAVAEAKKKAADELAWRKNLEEEAKLKAEIEARAKIEAERKKEEEEKEAAAQKKKDEEAFKKRALEEATVKAEEANKKSLGKDKAPIKFKDAVGRKFSFPFHLCRTWQGMDDLIKQAFLHVDVIGPHVQQGHFDLIGPNGEIILPQVWDKVIEPDWSVTMHMWPMDRQPGIRIGPNGRPMPGPAGMPMGGRPGGMPGVGATGRRPMGPPPPPGAPQPPPPGGFHFGPGGPGPRDPRIVDVPGPGGKRSSGKKPSSKGAVGITGFLFGGSSKPKGKKPRK